MIFNTRVLIVEDRLDFQEMFREYVSEIPGFDTLIAASLGQAVGLLDKFDFDVALVDLRLNDTEEQNFDGLRVLHEISEHDLPTKVIILSAYIPLDRAKESFQKDVFALIDKSELEPKTFCFQIQEAARLAQRDKMRPSRRIFQIKDVLGVESQYVLGKLAPNLGNNQQKYVEEFESFLRRLLTEFMPLLTHETNRHLLELHTDVHINFWSKRLGFAIEVRFAYADDPSDLHAERYADSILVSEKIWEVFDPFSFPHFGGYVFARKDLSFEDFVLRT